ncbi:p53-like transcription factor DNA-binding [Penicillium atrosanguineum]|uniref:P53-like transcription factor DNA-binding n=1 Tax=Penicillium atrosanguineum TaxID=1132637 RepID=A0A9W9Q4Y9_9EURO|nr:p53-like transcription factor DNA-binding [Penicillium atrosanguineum]
MDCPATTEGDYIGSHVTGFPFDDDDCQRVGALASIPVTNGVRYHAQQPAMQDLHHPPAMQTASHASSIPALMGRSNTFSSTYTLHRGMGMPLTGVNDVSRAHQYSGTSRVLEETSVLEAIVAEVGGTQQTVKPDVQAKIGRGFFSSDGKWTCYRRNYFAVTCSFSLHPWPSTVPLYIRHPDQTLEPIRGFAMSISAIVNGQYGDTRELVQHTPKRDKLSERKPCRIPLQPSPPPSFGVSTGNHGHVGFPLGSQSTDYNTSFTGTPQPCAQPATSHMFERIQFQKATANNGKRRAQQQFYNLVVELHAEVSGPVGNDPQWVLIARKHSHQMVVRGRSPGHYKDGRRDSTTSMGPDGSSGDGPGGLSHGMGQNARSPLMMYDGHRSSLSYGRQDYRQMSTTEHSPLSDSPLISSSSSSGFDYSMMNDTMDPMDTMKTASTLDPYQDPEFPAIPNQHRSSAGGYDPVYSTYGRYDPIQNPHSLCT